MPDIVVSFLSSFMLWTGNQMPLVTLPTTSEKSKKLLRYLKCKFLFVNS